MKFNPLAAAVVSIVLLLILVVLLRSVIGAPVRPHAAEQKEESQSSETMTHKTITPEVIEEKVSH